MSVLLLNERVAPSAPASSKVKLYAKADGRLYGMDDAGVEFSVGGPRRDVTANKGTASSYPGQYFIENRQAGSTPDRGDQIWISLQKDDASWEWTFLGSAT